MLSEEGVNKEGEQSRRDGVEKVLSRGGVYTNIQNVTPMVGSTFMSSAHPLAPKPRYLFRCYVDAA